jgi:hypothetical protein
LWKGLRNCRKIILSEKVRTIVTNFCEKGYRPLVRDSSAVRRHFFFARAWDVRELYIRKTANLPLQLLVGTFPRFVAIGFYLLSEILIYIASPIIFLFFHNHLTLRKWCYTSLQHDFAREIKPLKGNYYSSVYGLYIKVYHFL